MRCSYCAAVLEPGGKFCGGCGRQVSPSYHQSGTSNGYGGSVEPGAFQPSRASEGTVPPGPFFSHAEWHPVGSMTNATRYLCAAAYLSPRYAGTIIRELVASHRAVAPSVGIDVGPVIRHCLRARNMQLTRDLLVAALLIINLLVDPGTAVAVLFIAFLLGFLPSVDWSRKSLKVKIFAVAGSLFLIGNFILVLFILGLVTAIRGTQRWYRIARSRVHRNGADDFIESQRPDLGNSPDHDRPRSGVLYLPAQPDAVRQAEP